MLKFRIKRKGKGGRSGLSNPDQSRQEQYEELGEPLEQKEYWLTTLAVNNRVAVYVLTGIIFLMGVVAYINIPKESAPEVVFPVLYVATPYFGVAPLDIESQVTHPIEKQLKGISGIKKITSKSYEGYSAITVEFNPHVDMNVAFQRVREKVDLAKPDLPDDADEPQIVEINLSEMPILYINISGDYSLVKLKEVAEDIKDDLEEYPEVLEAVLSGGLEREVAINVDLNKLKYYKVTFQDIINAIRNENTTIPGGTIDVQNMKYLVRVPGEFAVPEVIGDIVVKTPKDGGPIYVRDLAKVDFGFKDRESYARLDKSPVVTLAVKKRAGTNIIALSDKVKDYIANLQSSGKLPPSTNFKITNDQSDNIRDMVSNLENSIISGLILVILVLLFFMGSRNATLVGIAIPMSMLLSFVIISALGFTMNMIVLFSLILALGMLVDNAIVVVENIYRYVGEGADKITAAKRATGEVAVPIITSTLTTLFAFLPMAFWPGIVGEFMKYLPITLIITLGSSLFVALVINPTLASRIMRLDGEKGRGLTRVGKIVVGILAGLVFLIIAMSNIITAGVVLVTLLLLWGLNRVLFLPVGIWLRERGFPALQGAYRGTLRLALDHRLLTMLSIFGVSVVIIGLYANFNNGMEFFPNIEPRQVNVNIQSPIGTTVEQSNRIAKKLESRLGKVPGYTDVQATVTTVGSSASGGRPGGGSGGVPNEATIALSFKKYQDRNQSPFETLSELRGVMGTTLDGADVKVMKMEMGPPTGRPVSIEIRGEDAQVIDRESEKILAKLKASPIAKKLDALESDLQAARPELTVRIDREKAALYGLNTALIGSTIRSAINGTDASTYRDGEDEYDITVRLKPDQRSDLESLKDLTVMKEGRQIPLVAVADWEVTDGYGVINRKDLERVVTIGADIVDGYNANAVVKEVKDYLADYKLPPGYTMTFAGQQEDQQETGSFLMMAFGVAILLVYGTLVAQFNSMIKPFIIMASVLFSTMGVLLGLMIFQLPFGMVMTGVGVISLAGVAVNNAIVLIDFIEVRRTRDHMPLRQAIIDAGSVRLRPVMLTTVTTILGLVPLALGLNFDFFGLFSHLQPNFFMGGEQQQWWLSLSIAVMFGLTFSTFLTLVVVPVMYSIAESIAKWGERTFLKGPRPQLNTVNGSASGAVNGNGAEAEIEETVGA